jgi:hypothetical protein
MVTTIRTNNRIIVTVVTINSDVCRLKALLLRLLSWLCRIRVPSDRRNNRRNNNTQGLNSSNTSSNNTNTNQCNRSAGLRKHNKVARRTSRSSRRWWRRRHRYNSRRNSLCERARRPARPPVRATRPVRATCILRVTRSTPAWARIQRRRRASAN